MRALILLTAARFFLVIMLCGLLPQGSTAGEPQNTKVKDEKRVTLQVTDVPLNEVLSILAKNVPLEIKGTVPSQERITVQFFNVTLEEALSRIMRGYNYVLVRPQESTKPLLVVMSKIERSIKNEPASAGPVPAGPPVSGSATLPAVASPQTGRPQPDLPGPVPSSGPAPATGPIPPFPGMPGGPGAIPPGIAAGSGGPASAAGNLPPGIFPSPGATNPPPGSAAGTSAPLPASPAQPQQPAQPTREPARIMTPFGERSAD